MIYNNDFQLCIGNKYTRSLQIFKQYDEDEDGILSPDEFHDSLIALGQKLAISDAEKLYTDILDKTHRTKLEYGLLLEMAEREAESNKENNKSKDNSIETDV